MNDADRLRGISDSADRVRRATKLLADYQNRMREINTIRRLAISDMLSAGMTRAAIARSVGLTPARVGKIIADGGGVERAFFGAPELTVAIGAKPEVASGASGPVLSDYARRASALLADLARSLELVISEPEVIAPEQIVRLNRSGLVVIGGPRLLPWLGQVIEADPAYGFAEHGGRWCLVDRTSDVRHYSPADDGKAVDYGYLGRLPRPDGRGSFLYAAGLHGPGTTGVVHHLAEHLGELYRDVGAQRFSVLIECQYDVQSRTVTSTDVLAPIVIHR